MNKSFSMKSNGKISSRGEPVPRHEGRELKVNGIIYYYCLPKAIMVPMVIKVSVRKENPICNEKKYFSRHKWGSILICH